MLYLIKPFSRSVLKEFLIVLLEIFRLACIGLIPELSVKKPKPAFANTEVLSNIVIDLCYTSNKNKTFAWDVAGEQIFNNILKNNDYKALKELLTEGRIYKERVEKEL